MLVQKIVFEQVVTKKPQLELAGAFFVCAIRLAYWRRSNSGIALGRSISQHVTEGLFVVFFVFLLPNIVLSGFVHGSNEFRKVGLKSHTNFFRATFGVDFFELTESHQRSQLRFRTAMSDTKQLFELLLRTCCHPFD